MLGASIRLGVLATVHFVSAQHALADLPTISPNEIVERDFLIYQVGSSVPFTGAVVSARYNGSTDYEENYVDGKLHGLRTEWDQLGNKISETTYKNGMKTGPESFWYENGQLMAVTHFLNGSYHGQFSRWCRNGQKRFEWTYANHIKNGRQAAWYNNGQKQYEGVYSDGKRGDRFTRWYENGQVHTDYKVDATSQVSTTTTWFQNGQKKCETVFSKSKGEPLTRTAWDENGSLLEIEGETYLAHCRSSLGSSAVKLRPGETYASVRHRRSAGETRFTTTRYSTVGDETTATEIELSDSEYELMVSRGQDAKECGLRAIFP